MVDGGVIALLVGVGIVVAGLCCVLAWMNRSEARDERREWLAALERSQGRMQDVAVQSARETVTAMSTALWGREVDGAIPDDDEGAVQGTPVPGSPTPEGPRSRGAWYLPEQWDPDNQPEPDEDDIDPIRLDQPLDRFPGAEVMEEFAAQGLPVTPRDNSLRTVGVRLGVNPFADLGLPPAEEL